MSDFESINVENAEGSLSSDEFIIMSHEPEMLYHYIKGVASNFDEDNDIYEENESSGIYARVETFRAFMQYIEEFGIYLLYELEDKEDLVKHVTETSPKEVKRFFEKAINSKEEEYLELDGDKTYEGRLESIFGYDLILEDNVDISEIKEKEDLGDEEIVEKIDNSTEAIKAHIREIANFFLQFEDAYNAIKHGTRVMPKQESKIEITGPANFEGELNFEMVTFLCKKDNEKYLLGIPVELLVQESLKRLETLKMVFEDIREVSQAYVQNPEQINFRFYERVPNTSNVSDDYMAITNPDSRIILPAKEKFREYMDKPLIKPVGANIYPEGSDVVFETANLPYTEPEYPIKLKMKAKLSDGVQPTLEQANQDFTFNLGDLDIEQYQDLFSAIKMLEEGEAKRVRIRDISKSQDYPMEPGNMEKIERPSKVSEENLETLKSIQLATEERILMPLEINEEVQSILDEYRESNKTKSEAQECLRKLKEKGVSTGLSANQRAKIVLRAESDYILDYEDFL